MNAYNDVTPLAPRLVTIAQHFIEDLAAFLEAKRGTSDVLLSAIDQLNRAKVTCEEMRSREEAIAVNPRLSSVGRREEMATLTKEFAGRLSFIRTAASDRKKAADQLRQALTAIPKPTHGEVTDYLIGCEIRSRFSKLATAERMTVLTESLRRGETHLLRAIETDPMREALVPAEFLERLKAEGAKHHDGGREFVRLESLEFTHERLEQFAAICQVQLAHYDEVPSYAPPTIRTTDLQMENQQTAPVKNPAVDKAPAQQPQFQ